MRVNTGEPFADVLFQTIIDALNAYVLNLTEKQIRLTFEQSQKEVDNISQRTKEGIETDRRNGKQIGGYRGRKKKGKPIKEMIWKFSRSFDENLKDKEVIAVINSGEFHVCINTYYKYKREM